MVLCEESLRLRFGRELLIDLDDCSGEITNIKSLNKLIDDICLIGGMSRKGEPLIEYFPDDDFNRERDIVGYSICQIISLSNITFHINEISKTVYINYFTCGDLKVDETMEVIRNYFKAKKEKFMIVTRDAKTINFF